MPVVVKRENTLLLIRDLFIYLFSYLFIFFTKCLDVETAYYKFYENVSGGQSSLLPVREASYTFRGISTCTHLHFGVGSFRSSGLNMENISINKAQLLVVQSSSRHL